MNRDVVVIGGSAGGMEVLLELVAELPASLRAAVFVVLHRSPDGSELLPELLSRRGPLPARHPLHDERIELGNIYIAPSDNQLLLRPGSVEVVRGPRENGHRPAVDALFRTASAAYGPRVIGVVLSGYQDCGTAGMMSIKARGGISVVQAPESAQAPHMPQSVLDRVAVDHVARPRQLAALLARLVSEAPGPVPPPPGNDIAQLEGAAQGSAVGLVCPTCQGALSEAEASTFHHFRCHVGHAFSLQSLVQEQSEALERALWAAVRALEESAGLSRRLSNIEKGELRHRFSEKATTQLEQAELIRHILLHGTRLTRDDGG